jgi:hypothetical protein
MYEFVFVRSTQTSDDLSEMDTDNAAVTIRAFGNTARVAEHWARRQLREDQHVDPTHYYTRHRRFVPASEREEDSTDE